MVELTNRSLLIGTGLGIRKWAFQFPTYLNMNIIEMLQSRFFPWERRLSCLVDLLVRIVFYMLSWTLPPFFLVLVSDTMKSIVVSYTYFLQSKDPYFPQSFLQRQIIQSPEDTGPSASAMCQTDAWGSGNTKRYTDPQTWCNQERVQGICSTLNIPILPLWGRLIVG
jgi:hypothetical protein